MCLFLLFTSLLFYQTCVLSGNNTSLMLSRYYSNKVCAGDERCLHKLKFCRCVGELIQLGNVNEGQIMAGIRCGVLQLMLHLKLSVLKNCRKK